MTFPYDPKAVGFETDALSDGEFRAYYRLVHQLWMNGPMNEEEVKRATRANYDVLRPMLSGTESKLLSFAWLEKARSAAERLRLQRKLAGQASANARSTAVDQKHENGQRPLNGRSTVVQRSLPEGVENPPHPAARKRPTPEELKAERERRCQERLQAFRLECLKVHQEKKLLDDAEAKAFFTYWSERSQGARKHRWEFEKVFDIARRMTTWAKNLQFKGPDKPAPEWRPQG